MKHLILILSVLIGASQAGASTIRVERDGSGDFLVIQDAVDAAASGDTILVGPGRYDEGSTVVTPGWTEFVRVLIPVEDLTIIGAGSDVTIIGPSTPYDRADGGHRGIEFSDFWGGKSLTLVNIGFENMFRGVDCHFSNIVDSRLAIRGCRFYGCGISCDGSVFQFLLAESIISNITSFGMGMALHGSGTAEVTDSIFRELTPWTGRQLLYFYGGRDVTIDQCNFQWGGTGLYVGGGADLEMSGCSFWGQSGRGISVTTDVTANLIDVSITNQKGYGIQVGGQGTVLTAERLTVSDVDVATFRFWRPITGYIRDSILAKGAEYVVVADVQFLDPINHDLFHFDMTGNWWGSDNPDSIQAWIHDAVDDTTFSTVIDWEPFKDESVGVETQSLGSVKSMFR